MPGIALHLTVADRILDTWAACPSAAPFPLDDPDSINAFRHGSVGPDLGYFPGGKRILSDLSHCHRSGQLTESLVDRARTPVERAFAWGWATHVLADRIIHPLIALAVGEHLTGSTDCFVDGDRDQIHHIRIEVGLDIWVALEMSTGPCPPSSPVFDEGSIRFVTQGYEGAYGTGFESRVVLDSHRAAHRSAHVGLWLMGVMAPAIFHDTGSARTRMVRWLLQRAYGLADGEIGQESLILALFTPVPPSPRLTSTVRSAVDEVLAAFWDRYFSRSGQIEDFNLDNGLPERDAVVHRGAARARAYVQGPDLRPPHAPPVPALVPPVTPQPVATSATLEAVLRDRNFSNVPSRIGDPSATPR